MSDYSCNIVIRSKQVGSGARPHKEKARRTPVDSKILMFMLCIQLLECYIINPIVSLAMKILYVYVQSMINMVWNLLEEMNCLVCVIQFHKV